MLVNSSIEPNNITRQFIDANLRDVMETGELGVREIQLRSLDVLRVIDGICHHLGLKYWLMYGTLIGAIRHRGFIPWDDDLDIAMFRKDYNTLVDFMDSHFEELHPLVALHSTKQRRLPFLLTRVSDTRYKMVGEYGKQIPELGIFVDIYPFDGIGNDLEAAERITTDDRKRLVRYSRAASDPYNVPGESSHLKNVLRDIRRRVFYSDVERYAQDITEAIGEFSVGESKYVSCRSWEPKIIRERALFDRIVEVPFEDMHTCIPAEYDAVLRSSYGDYMQLPPEEDRIGHHQYKIVVR